MNRDLFEQQLIAKLNVRIVAGSSGISRLWLCMQFVGIVVILSSLDLTLVNLQPIFSRSFDPRILKEEQHDLILQNC